MKYAAVVVARAQSFKNACLVAEVRLVEWRKILAAPCKDKTKKLHMAESPILVARLVWQRPMHRQAATAVAMAQAATVVAMAHMHRLTAKKVQEIGQPPDICCRGWHVMIQDRAPVVFTGEFSIQLFQIVFSCAGREVDR